MLFRFAHLTSRSCADKCSLQGDATHEPFPGSALPRSRSDSYGKREMRGNSRKARSFAVFYWGWHRVRADIITALYGCPGEGGEYGEPQGGAPRAGGGE